jgi:hypothetical protein
VNQERDTTPGLDDFDFLFGHWQVHYRKLKKRLANNALIFGAPLSACSKVETVAMHWVQCG